MRRSSLPLFLCQNPNSEVNILKHGKNGWQYIDGASNQAYQKDVDGKVYSYLKEKGGDTWTVTDTPIATELIEELKVFFDPKSYDKNEDGTYTFKGAEGMPAEDVSTIKVEKDKITLFISGYRYVLTDIGTTMIEFPDDLPPIK